MYRLYLFTLLALCSCAPTAYVPNSRNVPLFGEAKEFAGAVVLSSGIDVQLAYSVSDQVALMGNGSIIIDERTTDTSTPQTFNRDHQFGEIGLGFFGRSRAARFEIFGGYGLGQGTSYESFYFFQANPSTLSVITFGKYQRIFIQPSIGTNSKKFNIFFTPRFSLVNFTEFSTKDPAVTPTYSVYTSKKFSLVLEPSITTRFHLVGNLYGFFQLSLNSAVPSNVDFDFPTLQSAIGIQLHTAELRTRVY